jgi:hypothetical protein
MIRTVLREIICLQLTKVGAYNLLWHRITTEIVGWFAGRKCKIYSKGHS